MDTFQFHFEDNHSLDLAMDTLDEMGLANTYQENRDNHSLHINYTEESLTSTLEILHAYGGQFLEHIPEAHYFAQAYQLDEGAFEDGEDEDVDDDDMDLFSGNGEGLYIDWNSSQRVDDNQLSYGMEQALEEHPEIVPPPLMSQYSFLDPYVGMGYYDMAILEENALHHHHNKEHD